VVSIKEEKMERKETLELKQALEKDSIYLRRYGCPEITIGFPSQGYGNEVVDFMTMDSKGIFRCYEIKVTVEDLHSNAKKSWHGHYNYLVVSEELYNQIDDWAFLPDHIGIIVGYPYKTHGGRYLENVRKCKKQYIELYVETMLKDSMIRSMFWKMQKYKDANNLDKKKKTDAKMRKLEKERNDFKKHAEEAETLIHQYERYRSLNENTDFYLQDELKKEYQKYWKNKNKEIRVKKDDDINKNGGCL